MNKHTHTHTHTRQPQNGNTPKVEKSCTVVIKDAITGGSWEKGTQDLAALYLQFPACLYLFPNKNLKKNLRFHSIRYIRALLQNPSATLEKCNTLN